MARPTERALKRKPMAVILLTTLRKDIPDVPPAGREFEWFVDEKNMQAYFDQNVQFHKEDTAEHDDMAYLAVEITDTATMSLGRIDVQPDQKKMLEWAKSVEDDITKAFTPVKVVKDEGSEKKVRPRKKSSAAAAVKKETPAKDTEKVARLKERLNEKKGTAKKSESGDPAPKTTRRAKPKKATATADA